MGNTVVAEPPFVIVAQKGDFFARIDNLDLAVPMSDETFERLEHAFDKFGVLHFPGQKLTQEQQVAFSRRLGPLEIVNLGAALDGGRNTLPEINRVSNLGLDNRIRPANDLRRMHSMANRLWHTDSSYKHIPSKCSLLYAHIVPDQGGNTEYADMRAAYDALSASMKKQIEGLQVVHSIFASRRKIGFTEFSDEVRAAHPPVRQLLVRTHAGSGRKSLYLASHADTIVGWPEDEGRELLEELTRHATHERFVYSHAWRTGDLVMWDNRCTMHRATPYEDMHAPRDLHRTTVMDSGNTVEMARQ